MSDYQAPLQDMRFLLYDVFGVEALWAEWSGPDLTPDLANAILDEAARISRELIAPLNRSGDEIGVRFEDGHVITPPGFREAWDTYRAGGWIGLGGDPAHGGQGMPRTLTLLFEEMLHSASNAFCMYSILTSGMAMTLNAHGSDALKKRFIPPLYRGDWAGVMCLTEAHAGSDLGRLRTRAEPIDADAGRYRINGTKIFITGGEQDLTENILHLVLARLPDAPAGTDGISMFLVPKVCVDEDGRLGEPNGVTCGGIEHKMGIHASSTCTMHFEEAEGFLVGTLNRGLHHMFTMMNYERLSVGIQGLACAERGYQKAAAYAKERLQSRAPGAGRTPDQADPIIAQPDVRRLLLTQRALTEAGRAFALYAGIQLDLKRYGSEADRERAEALGALLTPVGKAFLTDLGLECCLHAQMVFGGHGYIRETGVEQLVRDARIAQIYEGTNGIQALDVIKRRVVASRGEHVAWVLDALRETLRDGTGLSGAQRDALGGAADTLEAVTRELLDNPDPVAVAGAATDYLHLLGYVLYGWMWARMLDALGERDDAFATTKRETAAFFLARLLPRADAHAAAIRAGSGTLMATPAEHF